MFLQGKTLRSLRPHPMSSRHVKVSLSLLMVLNLMIGVPVRSFAEPHDTTPTTSPIKHVIVIIGENRTFDHIFANLHAEEGADYFQPAFQRHY